MSKQYFIYMMANKNNNVIYTGVTNDLVKRVYQHKEKLIDGFTKKYNCNILVYYENFSEPYEAINREKQIKAGSRKRKIDLIKNLNPDWKDLYDEIASLLTKTNP